MQTERKDVYTKSNCALLLAMCLESLLDRGPRTLQLKLQKKLLSSIHTAAFFHNYKDFLGKIAVKFFNFHQTPHIKPAW